MADQKEPHTRKPSKKKRKTVKDTMPATKPSKKKHKSVEEDASPANPRVYVNPSMADPGSGVTMRYNNMLAAFDWGAGTTVTKTGDAGVTICGSSTGSTFTVTDCDEFKADCQRFGDVLQKLSISRFYFRPRYLDPDADDDQEFRVYIIQAVWDPMDDNITEMNYALHGFNWSQSTVEPPESSDPVNGMYNTTFVVKSRQQFEADSKRFLDKLRQGDHPGAVQHFNPKETSCSWGN